jgi:hypothetical protein
LKDSSQNFGTEFGITLKKVLLLSFKMQKSSHIARLFSVFMMSLMLMFTVFGKTFSASQMRVQAIQKAKTEQSGQSKESKQCSVSELSVMQVSAPVTIDFANDFIFTPQVFSFLSPQKKAQTSKNLSFRLPHLEILFEHFIVTNAP